MSLSTAARRGPIPGGLRHIFGGSPLEAILALLLVTLAVQLPAQPAPASAPLLPGHARERAGPPDGREARRCDCLRLTPFEVVVSATAGLLALTGFGMAALGFLRFRRTLQPAPDLFSAEEVLEIYRFSLTSAAGESWTNAVLILCLGASLLAPDGIVARIGINLVLPITVAGAVYFISRCGIPADIETAKLEHLLAEVGRLEGFGGGPSAHGADAPNPGDRD